jgi:hypothetical protein
MISIENATEIAGKISRGEGIKYEELLNIFERYQIHINPEGYGYFSEIPEGKPIANSLNLRLMERVGLVHPY